MRDLPIVLSMLILSGCSQQQNDEEIVVSADKKYVKISPGCQINKTNDQKMNIDSFSKLRSKSKCAKISTGATISGRYAGVNSLEYRDRDTMFYVGSQRGRNKTPQTVAIEKRFSGGF